MRLISRSSIRTYQACPRSYYHKYLDPEGGPGVEGVDKPDYYSVGIAFHEAGEVLLRGGSGAEAGEAAARSAESLGLSDRWINWCRAVALAWERTERDEFFEQYDVLSVEQEVTIPLAADVALYGRADAVLQERNTGAIYVWNWKTASDLRDWNRKFFLDIQSMVEATAVAGATGLDVDGVLYGGVWKGPMYKGYTTSRLVGGYCNRAKETYSPNREKGHTEKFNAWEERFPFGAGLPAWISWLPESLLRSHFATSAPQGVVESITDPWIRQIVRVESDIAHLISEGSASDILDGFPQHIGDQCTGCPYFDICAGRATTRGLLDDGRLRLRDDSHLPKVGEEEEE